MIRCLPDEDGCVNLLSVLRIVNQVSQEQVWAMCHQLTKLMRQLSPNCATIESLSQIYLHIDGHIHEKSLRTATDSPQQHQDKTNSSNNSNNNNNNNNYTKTTTTLPNTPPTPPITPELNEVLRRRPALSESELVASLGIALFWALDYGIPDDEERKLSETMERLIVKSQNGSTLKEIMELCINRLPLETESHAEQHYRSVCKSLVSDTMELSIFLEKIYTASMVLSDITLDGCLETTTNKCDISDDVLSRAGEPLASLRALRINDWARLWMQVIRELRQRGRFKQALSVN